MNEEVDQMDKSMCKGSLAWKEPEEVESQDLPAAQNVACTPAARDGETWPASDETDVAQHPIHPALEIIEDPSWIHGISGRTLGEPAKSKTGKNIRKQSTTLVEMR
jgi:hypothetical protein